MSKLCARNRLITLRGYALLHSTRYGHRDALREGGEVSLKEQVRFHMPFVWKNKQHYMICERFMAAHVFDCVKTRLCPPGAMEGVQYWRKVERSDPGRHNSSVPTRSDGRGVALAESGEVPTRAVTIHMCPPGAMEGVRYWRKVERSLPGPSQFVCAHQERWKGCGIGGKWRGPYPGRHNLSVPTISDGRGAVLAGSGEVPTRGRHDSSVPTRSEHQDRRGLVEWDQQTLPRNVRRRGANNPETIASHVPTARIVIHSEPQKAHQQPYRGWDKRTSPNCSEDEPYGTYRVVVKRDPDDSPSGPSLDGDLSAKGSESNDNRNSGLGQVISKKSPYDFPSSSEDGNQSEDLSDDGSEFDPSVTLDLAELTRKIEGGGTDQLIKQISERRHRQK